MGARFRKPLACEGARKGDGDSSGNERGSQSARLPIKELCSVAVRQGLPIDTLPCCPFSKCNMEEEVRKT